MADPGTVLTVVLVAVFVVSLALGLLFLLGTKRPALKSVDGELPPGKPPVYRGQGGRTIHVPDTMGPGSGRLYRWLDNSVNLLLGGLVSLYKWAFSYNGLPAAPSATTVVSEEPRTRLAEPPPPAAPPVSQYQQPVPPPPPPTWHQPPDRSHGLQAIIDIIGEGIEITLTGMSDGIVFVFDGFINVFKWIFRIDR